MPATAGTYFALLCFFISFSSFFSWLHQWHFFVMVNLCVCVSVCGHAIAENAICTSDRCMYQQVFNKGACGMRYDNSVFTHSSYLCGSYGGYGFFNPSNSIAFAAAAAAAT